MSAGSRRLSWNRQYCIALFLCACVLQLCRVALLRNAIGTQTIPGREHESPPRPVRQVANYTEVYRYGTHTGASFSLVQVQWETSPGILQSSNICHFKNLCVEHYRGPRLTGTQKYWLAASTDQPHSTSSHLKDIEEAQDAFRRCFNAPFTPAPTFSLEGSARDPEHINWFKGHTFGSVKADYGTHPLSWLNIFARLVSLATNVPDLLSTFCINYSDYFNQTVLFEQGFALNEWTIGVMDAAAVAAREALPGGVAHNAWQSMNAWNVTDHIEILARQPTYHDHRYFSRHGTDKVATCFESLLVPALSNLEYFRNNYDAEYLKKWAFARARLIPRTSNPCDKEKLKAVIALRDDRPLWNVSGIVETMHSAGLRDISFMSITAATPYRDQLKMWNDADIVVSVHGSHLTNHFFMAPHAGLIEIFTPDYNNDHQARLAAVTRINHVKLLSNTLVEEKMVKDEHPSKLEEWKEMHQAMKKYPRPSECYKHIECRRGARRTGGLAKPSAFREAIVHIIDLTINRQECSL